MKAYKKLIEHDWNFIPDRVPDDEVVACCYWEYARESKFILEVTKLMAELRDGKRLYNSLGAGPKGLLEQLDNICERPDADPNHFYRCPPFPQPWQSLDKANKPPRMLIISAVEYAFQAIDSRLPWRRFQHQTERRVINHDIETLLVTINWGAGSDAEIKKSFNKWLDKNRPSHIPEPSERGHKPVDWRARLERLGLLRLRHNYSFDEAKPLLKMLPQTTKTTDSSECNRQAKNAVDDFHALVPFLDSSAMPISWPLK